MFVLPPAPAGDYVVSPVGPSATDCGCADNSGVVYAPQVVTEPEYVIENGYRVPFRVGGHFGGRFHPGGLLHTGLHVGLGLR
jgi:hypothetical protein